MAEMKAKRKTDPSGKLVSIEITFADNGSIMVEKRFAPPKGDMDYSSTRKTAAFQTPGAALSYIEECMPKGEVAAHEASEGHDGY